MSPLIHGGRPSTRNSKRRHHNIETETVVRLAVKLMRVAYDEFYDRFCAVI